MGLTDDVALNDDDIFDAEFSTIEKVGDLLTLCIPPTSECIANSKATSNLTRLHNNAVCDPQVFGSPPSSVLRAFDVDSRVAEDFDPRLQHSSSPYTNGTINPSDVLRVPPEEEVDWDYIVPSQESHPSNRHECILSSRPITIDNGILTPHATMPSGSERRTQDNERNLNDVSICFHIKELINRKIANCSDCSKAKFELYARVAHSSRENFAPRQYFQLNDLFSTSAAQLTGILQG